MKLSTILGVTLVILLTFIGASMLWFSANTFYQRLSIKVQGTIISRQNLISPFNGFEFTEYRLQPVDGSTAAYQASRTDYSLSTNMPVGVTLIKREWRLDYSVDGREVDDFPKVYYSVVGLMGLVLVGGSIGYSINYALTAKKKPKSTIPDQNSPPPAE